MSHSDEGLLTIDLQAVGDNYLRLRQQTAGRCGAVVKADAYGLGMEKVAPVLYARDCRDFFVATLTEGISLRELLPQDAQIVVLTGVRAGRELQCAEAGLIPTLFTLQQLRAWTATSAHGGCAAPCALKIDSGMTRLGMTAEEFDQLLADEKLVRAANIKILLSHLACADEPQHAQNRRQLASFQTASSRLRESCPDISLSLANSSGIFLGEDYHFDIARPGSALYGVNPVPGQENPMCAVVRLSLPIVQKRYLSGEQLVGYGATQSVAEGSWLAVVRGGYADGILRAQSGRGWGFAGEVKVPMRGRVSMDTTIFDISALSESQRQALDFIEVLNAQLTVDEVAGYAGTIGYEILTSLGRRYCRRYL